MQKFLDLHRIINGFKKYFNSRWMPSGITFAVLIIFGITLADLETTRASAQFFANILDICTLGILLAAINNLIKKQWKNGVLHLLMFFVFGIVIGILFTIISMFGPPEDGFADNLKIPDNIPITEPKNEKMSANERQTDQPSINLRDSFSAGIYDSEIWINPGEEGKIYLRAFEVTKNTPLSVERLKESSSDFVRWSNDSSQLFFSSKQFMIEEGDWGKAYAARFEVWFIPNSGEGERKLLERVFKIEGWQR